MKRLVLTQALLAGLTLSFVLPAHADDRLITDVGTLDKETADKVFPAKRPYSPYAGRNFPTRPLFGDTHLHTMFSFDAGAFGARLGPSDAYRFAKGEEVMASSGQPAKLSRPLDFLVVADHSDNMGFFPDLLAGKPEHAGRSDGPPMVRHDPVRTGRRRSDRDDHRLLARHVPEGSSFAARHAGLPLRLAGDHQGRRGGERSRPLHGLHRLRVDVEHRRQQSPPQRHLPRQRRQGQPGRALHHDEPARQRQSARPVEVDGGLRGKDRRRRARHRPQRQSLQRPHVPDHRVLHRQADRPRICRDPREVGAPLRGDADQGRRRDPSRSCRPTTSSPISSAGTRATST